MAGRGRRGERSDRAVFHESVPFNFDNGSMTTTGITFNRRVIRYFTTDFTVTKFAITIHKCYQGSEPT